MNENFRLLEEQAEALEDATFESITKCRESIKEVEVALLHVFGCKPEDQAILIVTDYASEERIINTNIIRNSAGVLECFAVARFDIAVNSKYTLKCKVSAKCALGSSYPTEITVADDFKSENVQHAAEEIFSVALKALSL